MRLTVNTEVNYYPATSRLQASQKRELYKETANNTQIFSREKKRKTLDVGGFTHQWPALCLSVLGENVHPEYEKATTFFTNAQLFLCFSLKVTQMLSATIAAYLKTHSSEWRIPFSSILSCKTAQWFTPSLFISSRAIVCRAEGELGHERHYFLWWALASLCFAGNDAGVKGLWCVDSPWLCLVVSSRGEALAGSVSESSW